MAAVMLALPLARLAVGVKTAVRVRPVPLIVLNEPPVTTTSPELPSQPKLVPGSSENVKVISAVSPAFSEFVLAVMATVGVIVSMLMLGVTPAEPLLPAAS